MNLWVAFSAGVLTALSPCVLPILPTFLAFLAGERSASGRLLMRSAVFVLGLAAVFVAMGLTATAVGRFLVSEQMWLTRLGGAMVLIMGLHEMGVLRIAALAREMRPFGTPSKEVAAAPLLLGMTFGIGWTACVGPVLASILVLAARQDRLVDGATLLTSYALGMGLPLFALAGGLGPWLLRLRRASWYGLVQVLAGLLLVILGVLMLSGSLGKVAGLLA